LGPATAVVALQNSNFLNKKGSGAMDGDTKAVVISNCLCIVELNFEIATTFFLKQFRFDRRFILSLKVLFPLVVFGCILFGC